MYKIFRTLPHLLITAATIAAYASLLPNTAQAAPRSTTCQVTIALDQGGSLTYQLQGNILNPNPNQPQIFTPKTLLRQSIRMTVRRRDRNGRIQTFLNKSPLRDYEEIGPDADYSKVPFTGIFRGKPNDGKRIYKALAASHGLYVSLRPTNSQAKQMQIVHYLSHDKFIRSSAGTCRSL